MYSTTQYLILPDPTISLSLEHIVICIVGSILYVFLEYVSISYDGVIVQIAGSQILPLSLSEQSLCISLCKSRSLVPLTDVYHVRSGQCQVVNTIIFIVEA
jgi:hypothetical protein